MFPSCVGTCCSTETHSMKPIACSKNNLNPCSVWLKFLAYGMQHISTDWYVHAMFSNRFDLFQQAIRKLVEKNREEQRILESRFNVNQTQRCQKFSKIVCPFCCASKMTLVWGRERIAEPIYRYLKFRNFEPGQLRLNYPKNALLDKISIFFLNFRNFPIMSELGLTSANEETRLKYSSLNLFMKIPW